MHKFKAFSNDELNEFEKQTLWHDSIGGSRLKSLLDKELNYIEYLIATDQETNDEEIIKKINFRKADFEKAKTKTKMLSGKMLEEIIVEMLRELTGLGDRIVVDKRTFVSEHPAFKGRVHANIDAFVITEEGYQLWKANKISDLERINYIEFIIEIKNTQMNEDNLRKWYSEQPKFYSYFFNAKKDPMLVYLQNGWDLKSFTIPYNNQEFINYEIKKVILPWIKSILTKKYIQPELIIEEEDEKQEIEMTPEYITLIEKLRVAKEQIKAYTAIEKEIVDKIKDDFNNVPNSLVLLGVSDTRGYTVNVTNQSRKYYDYKSELERLQLEKIKIQNTIKKETGKDFQELFDELLPNPEYRENFTKMVTLNSKGIEGE